jgi:peptidoglycan/LPS O-acetylase OafA/YrhL
MSDLRRVPGTRILSATSAGRTARHDVREAGPGPRRDGFDAVKGVCIFAVLLIHALSVGPLPIGSAPGVAGLPVDVVVRQFVDFPVFVFLGVSGYFAGASARSGRSFSVRRRLWRLLPAYLLATFVTSAVLAPGHLVEPRKWVAMLLAGTGIGIGYYVVVLVQFVVATPLLLAIRSWRVHLAIGVSGSLLGIGFTYWAARAGILFPYSGLLAVVWFPSYQVGLILGRRKGGVPVSWPVLFAAWVVGIALSVGEAAAVGSGDVGFAVSQVKLSSIFTSLVILIAAVRFATGRGGTAVPGWLACVGKSSYFIYLYHLPLLGVLMSRLGRVVPFSPLASLMGSLVVLAVLGCVAPVARRVLGAGVASRCLGA